MTKQNRIEIVISIDFIEFVTVFVEIAIETFVIMIVFTDSLIDSMNWDCFVIVFEAKQVPEAQINNETNSISPNY